MMQDLTRIDLAVQDGRARRQRGPAGNLHRRRARAPDRARLRRRHPLRLEPPRRADLARARELDVRDLVLHAFTDGRDTLPHSGAGFLAQIAATMRAAGAGRIGTVVGRYYAMDRDKRWDRVQLAYDMLVHGRAEHTAMTGEAGCARRLRARRDRRVHHPGARRRGGADPTRATAVFAFNFRPDRMREITRALADPDVRRRSIAAAPRPCAATRR